MTVKPEWSETALETLRTMWAEGKSAREIGNVLNKSKSAVIAKIHRIGLPRDVRRTPAKPRVMAPQPALVTVLPRPPRVVVAERPGGGGLDITELRHDSCRWIHPDGTYCGARTAPGKSYCAEHAAICYTRGGEE